MKNIIKFYTVVFIILIMFFTHATGAYALKRAIFPDSKSLQPIPQNAYPNVSGNINGVTADPQASIAEEQSETAMQVEKQTEKNTTQTSSTSSYVIWSIIILLGLIIIFGFYFKNRKTTI